jgi:5-methylcytosine-specific restriction endonuclease McrA
VLKNNAHWARNNPEKVRDSRAKRAGLRAASWVEDVDFDVIIERAQGNCCLCGLPVDFEAAPRSRTAPTLEHLTPLERDGEHSYANCDLAHVSCNSSKRTLTLDEFHAREAARPFRRTCFALMAAELGLAGVLGVDQHNLIGVSA